jgi:hypothetical protein
MIPMPPYAFNIDVPVRTEWRNVTLLVTSVQNCFNAMFANVEGSQTIAMVTGELLENAIKYGAWSTEDQGDQLFRLSVAGRDHVARVLVENPAQEINAAELMKTLKWIRSFERPEEAYRAKLLEIAQQPITSGVSKLGLVRVYHEAACTIDASFDKGVVRVTADVKL